MTTTPTPTRETLASLLAALHYGQYADNDEHAGLKRNIERALKDFDIGRCEFATPVEIAQPATPEPAETRFSRWIRVEDRLPTHRHSVLGVVVDGPMVVAGDQTDRLVDIVSYGGPGDPRWLQFTGDEDAVVTVTHWMPRPPLPDSREQRKHDAAVAIAGPMARSFEVHTGVSWTDPEWRQETALWAAAWRLATQPATPEPTQASAPSVQAVEPIAQQPVAWRYTDSRGHFRYRGFVPGFDTDYPMLKPIPLYASPTALPATSQQTGASHE